MLKHRKQLLRSFVAVVSISALAFVGACGSNSSSAGAQQIRVSWWGGDAENKAVNATLDAFQKKSGVKTLRESQDFNGYWDKLSTQTAAKNAPDLEMQAGSQIPNYSGKNALVDLNTISELDTSSMDEGLKSFGAVNDKLYGVTAASNAYGLISNDTMLKKTGVTLPEGEWSWDDLADVARQVSAKLDDGVWALADQSGDLTMFVVWLRDQTGKDLYTDDGKFNATRDDIAGWSQWWDDLRKAGVVPPADVTSEGAAGQAQWPIVQQKVVMTFGWTQDFTSVQNLIPGSLSIHMPPYTDDNPSLWMNAASMWSVSATSKNQKAAAKAISYMLNDDAAIKAMGTALGIPPTQHARDLVKKDANEVQTKAIDFMDLVAKHSRPLNRLWPDGFPQVRTKMTEVQEAYAFGNASLDQALDDLFAEVENYNNE